MKRQSTILLLSLALTQPLIAAAGEKPPMDAKPLSMITQLLEQQGYSPIVEISFDDGRWEVEAYKDGVKRELKVDPSSGDVLSDRPDD